MLTLALIIEKDACGLGRALDALAGVAQSGRRIVIVEGGTDGRDSDRIQAFRRRTGADAITVGSHLRRGEAEALVRQRTGCEYLIAFGCDARINPAGLSALEAALSRSRPDLVVTGAGSWLGGPDHPVLHPDAERTHRATLTADARCLYPDPRRVLIRGGDTTRLCPIAEPEAAWRAWSRLMDPSKAVLVEAQPLILHPLPQGGPAPLMAFIASEVGNAPWRDQARRLAALLPWLGDAFALAPPNAAQATIGAAEQLLARLARRERQTLCTMPGAPGAVLRAIRARQQGEALAHLSLLATARSDAAQAAIAAQHAALQADLEAALPGPEYLRALHRRLRAMA